MRMKIKQQPCNDSKAWGRRWPNTHCAVRYSLGPAGRSVYTGSPACGVTAHNAMVEAASAPIVQAAHEQPPCLDFTDVNRHNFKAVLPIMRAAIQEATFVAIDAEFTGLFPEGVTEDPLDDYEERYKRVLASADNFVICQFGLSAFKWHAAAAPGGGAAARGGHWEAKTFNAYVFPRADDKTGWDKRFLCQSSSLGYLAEQGFDFNKMIHDGIGFIPLAVREAKVRSLREEIDKTQRSREVRSPKEEALVEATRSRVLSWLLDSEPELLLPLPPRRRLRTLLRLLLQDEFQLPSLGYDPFAIEFCGRSGDSVATDGSGSASAEEDDGPLSVGSGGTGTWREEAEVEVGSSDMEGGEVSDGEAATAAAAGEGGEEFLRLRRLDRWRSSGLIASGQQLTPRQRIEMLVEQSGFSQVLDILRDARRPLVGHNASLDLAYTLSQFNGVLPRNWRAYKALLQRAFPGGLYDTKHIATQLLAAGVPIGDTGLGNLYRTLMDEQWLRANVPGAGLPTTLGGGIPEICHALGFPGYVGVSVEKAHEAGFDAFMTGAAFTRLLRLVAAKAIVQSGGGGAAAASADASSSAAAAPSSTEAVDMLLQPLAPYRGRVHLMRSDLPYTDLYGNDPLPSRPAVLHVAGFGPQTRPPFLLQRFSSLGFNPVQVCMLTAPNGAAVGALVQLARPDLVPRAIQAVRKRWSNWTVMSFTEYYQNRLQQQQQDAGAGVPGESSGAGTGGAGSLGRVAPRMIRTTAASGNSQEGLAGKVQRRGGGEGGALASAARADSGAAAAAIGAAAVPSDAAGARKQQPGGGAVLNEPLPAHIVATAVRASGAAVSETAPFTSVGAIAEDVGVSGQSLQPHSDAEDVGGLGEEKSMAPTFTAATSATGSRSGGSSGGASANGGLMEDEAAASSSRPESGTGADVEAAKRAAERLRSLALAAQRLKSWPLRDERGTGGADGGLALQRPGRPAR